MGDGTQHSVMRILAIIHNTDITFYLFSMVFELLTVSLFVRGVEILEFGEIVPSFRMILKHSTKQVVW